MSTLRGQQKPVAKPFSSSFFAACFAHFRHAAFSAPAATGSLTSHKETDLLRQFTTVRRFVTLPLALLAALLCLGTLSAPAARAGTSITSITGIPSPVPAAGAGAYILVDTRGSVGTPTGSVTIFNGNGANVSTNTVFYYQADADGNPIVYTYVRFPSSNAFGLGTPTYTVTVSLTSGDGSTATQNVTAYQGQNAPITIDSLSASPSTLQATDTSLSVTVHITANGTNQAGFLTGGVTLLDSSGNIVTASGLQSLSTDSTGNPVLTTTLGGLAVNTGSSPVTYSVSIFVEDKTAIRSYASLLVTQLPASTTPAATSVAVPAVTGTLGQSVTLSATLTANNAALSGRTIQFVLDGTPVGSTMTGNGGVASLAYALPSGASVGNHTLTASFAGDSGDLASSGSGTLTANSPGAGAVSTAITITNPNGPVGTATGRVGTTVILRGRLRRTADSVRLSGETLTFSLDGRVLGTGVTAAGTGLAYFSYAIPSNAAPGAHTLTVSFAGDPTYAVSSRNGTLTITN